MTTDSGELSAIEFTLWRVRPCFVKGLNDIVTGDGLVASGVEEGVDAVDLVQCHNLAVKDLHDEVERLTQWVGDLQTGLYVNCIYCGFRYPPGTPDVRDQALYNHIKDCEYHPLSKALAEIEELRSTLTKVYSFIKEREWREVDPDPYPTYEVCNDCSARGDRGHEPDCPMHLMLERLKGLIDG